MFGVISYANEGVYTNTAESERGTIHQLKFHRSNRSRRPTANINSVHEYLLFLIPLFFLSPAFVDTFKRFHTMSGVPISSSACYICAHPAIRPSELE
jgi:hypothetical protein